MRILIFAVTYWTPIHFVTIKNLEITLYRGRQQAAEMNEIIISACQWISFDPNWKELWCILHYLIKNDSESVSVLQVTSLFKK